MKMIRSSPTIFGRLKSRSERKRSVSSDLSGSERLKSPATRSTDLMARSPQS